MLNEIKNPIELLNYMNKNIKYKWMDKEGKIRSDMAAEMYEKYSLMTPQEVLDNRCGMCMDQVEFERAWFLSKGYQFETYSIQVIREDSSPGHAFLIYEEGSKWYWFENAWESAKGIYEYLSKEECLKAVINLLIEQNEIKREEKNKLNLYLYKAYPSHLSFKEIEEYDLKNNKIYEINCEFNFPR